MPLEVESFEQGVAWIVDGIGQDFEPWIPTPWLTAGRVWQGHLPRVREMKAYERRPQCVVERDWFRVAAKKLRMIAATTADSDLAWLSFDGETLRFIVCGATVIVAATGTAWNARHAIKGRELDHLPKRLRDPVPVSIWDGKLSIGNRAWSLAQQEPAPEKPVRTIPDTSPTALG